MDLYDIEAFLMVVRLNNFTNAAQMLSVTQPTLSRQIKRLESFLGFSLFIRKQGQQVVELTPKGEAFRQIALEIHQLCKKAKALNEIDEQPELRVSIVQSVISCVLPNFAQDFSIYHSNISLSLHTHYSDTAYTLLKKNELDIAIVGKLYSWPEIQVAPLFLEPWLFICSADGPYPDEVFPGDLDPNNSISMWWGFLSRSWIEHWFPSNYSSSLDWHTISVLTHKDSFHGGKWTVVPASVAHYIESAGFAKIHTLTDPPPPRIVYIAHNENVDQGSLKAFLQCVYTGLEKISEITPIYSYSYN